MVAPGDSKWGPAYRSVGAVAITAVCGWSLYKCAAHRTPVEFPVPAWMAASFVLAAVTVLGWAGISHRRAWLQNVACSASFTFVGIRYLFPPKGADSEHRTIALMWIAMSLAFLARDFLRHRRVTRQQQESAQAG